MAHAAIPAVDPQTHAEVASVITPARAADLAREEDSAAASPQAQSLPPAYSQWVSQDVAYIITPEERAQFLTLTSNEQRDAFIENFWARRNPAGAAPNSFREEHYARVAYANQHFADGRPGWQTSRGRTYIVLGKPYAIDSHPGGDPVTRTAPFEVWRYQTAGAAGQQVDIKFVADGPFGRYRLVSPDSAPAAVLRPSPPVSASNLPAQVRPASTSSPVLSRVALSKTHPADDSAANYNPPADALPAHATADPVRVAGSVAAGMVISRINPIYPEEAKAAGVQGSVILKAVVSKAGTVDSLQVVSGPPALTTSAIDAVKRWKYSPYLLNGQPTDVQTTIAVNYTLDDAGRSNGPGSQDTAADLTPRKIGGNVSAPMVIYQVDPEYTPEARNARFGGVVLVNLVVDQQGVPQNVHVLRSLGMGLDAKALEAVKQYRFRPAMEDGKPVPVQLNIEVNFQIFRDPDASSSTAAPFHLRMSTPVLVARLEPLAFPFPQTLALKPILLQMAQQNSAGLYVARAQAAPAQSQALPELATPQYGLTDEQRKQLESNLDAAKRATAEAARRLNSPEFRKQMENAERPAADAKTRLNSPEFRKQMEDAKRQAMEAANRINAPEFHQQMEEAQKRALAAAKELNSADLRRMLDNARFQLDLHQSGVDTSEFHKEMEDIRRQISAAAEELREARDLANPPEKK
jgi:TonB family protein